MKLFVPPHIIQALKSMNISIGKEGEWTYADEYISELTAKWGKLDDPTFYKSILENETAENKAFVVYCILYSGDINEMIFFLEDHDQWVRWSAALALGETLVPQALQTLCEMIDRWSQEVLRTKDIDPQSWFTINLVESPILLARYNAPSTIPIMRQILKRTIGAQRGRDFEKIEVEYGEQTYDPFYSWLKYFQRNLLYALGRYNAFGSLVGIMHECPQLQVWRVHLVKGALSHDFEIGSMFTLNSNPPLKLAIEQYLTTIYGLDVDAIQEALTLYDIALDFVDHHFS